MRLIPLLIVLVFITACQSTNSTSYLPTDIPFPTMTVGQELNGHLSTLAARPNVRPGDVNPATAVALVNIPTATPDTGTCPTPKDDVELDDAPQNRAATIEAMLRFLNSGGSPKALTDAMIREWDIFGENGYTRDETDFTGEGVPELIIGYIAPGDVGTLLILGCQAGRYVQLYEIIADGIDPPSLIWVGEMNNNPTAEIVFTRRQCSEAEFCEFETQIITWAGSLGRFANLLESGIYTLERPSVRDIDNDEVSELVVELDSNGTSATGPLRTGVNIYDWNGEIYILSIIQLNAPRYHIQVVHEADKAFSNLKMEEAIELYELALEDEDLRYWFNDGEANIRSYALYRMILAHAFSGIGGGVLNTLGQLDSEFIPEEGETLDDLPVYVAMAHRFVDTLSISGDLHESCEEVQAIIEERSSALNLLNRYGSRSPNYDALQLCPF